jgi:putative ABC transport system permease protein
MVEGKTTSDTYVINSYAVNYDYLKTMGMELTEGRFFSRDFATDTVAIVINESAGRYLGLEKPLNQRLLIPIDDKGNKLPLTIIGVMKDFHYESLRKPINPMLFFLAADYFDGYVNIRIAPGKEKDAFEFITLTWNNLAPAAPLQYFYFSDQFNKMYGKEIETRHLMSILAIIAIIIASLGLLGLVAYMAERRTKEIGIRKVLGASVFSIIKMMTTEITILVAVAYIIAAPLAYWWMRVWLQQFTFKTSIGFWIFGLAGCVSIIIAWSTVSFITIKAAAQNPVNALKYE